MRERKACFGELIQIEGSDHDWFEGRSLRCILLVFVDDATGKLVELRFVPHESFFGYCEVARHYFERYGKPGAFSSDKHGIFHLNTSKVTPEDDMTDFSRAMPELGILIICANTPQFKGRVERANQSLQDCLTKELRLRGISTPEEANAWLPEFMEDYNQRFATVALSEINFHTPLSISDNLDHILCRKESCILSKNLTFQYRKTVYQIRVNRPSYAMRKAQVTVLENALGHVTVLYKNHPIPFEVYYQHAKQAEVVPSKSIDFELLNASNAHKPARDHLWRKSWPKKNAPIQGDILTLSD